MRAEYINPFITSLVSVFETMLSCTPRRGPLSIGAELPELCEVSGVIGLSGRAVGTVVLSLSRPVALQAASAMLMAETTEINSDVVDAIGELANMVAGAAKAQLEEYRLAISLPNVVTGPQHQVRFPSNVTPIRVPFDTDWGPLVLQVGLAAVPEACPA